MPKRTVSLGQQILDLFKEETSFTLQQVYEAIPDKPESTLRARIYDRVGKQIERLAKGVYRVVSGAETCVLVEGNGRDLSFLSDGSIDLIINDYPWECDSNRGGNRNFVNYETFTYTLEDFQEKARVLKNGSFLVEMLPAENEKNYEELFRIKQLAKAAGFQYYAKVPWKKGNFVGNTGRKAKNTEDMMIFSKGPARKLRLDAKKTKATGTPHYMSGSAQMLPVWFDIPRVSSKEAIHKSEKPVGLLEALINHLSLEGEWVLDQFAGSGVAGEAALKQKRNAVLIEACGEFVQKIKDRLKMESCDGSTTFAMN